MAWGLTLAAIASEATVWLLGVFVVPPTGLEELTAFSGRSTAYAQLALSGGVTAALLAGWLAMAGRLRAGRPWARTVLTVVGLAFLAFRAGGLGTDGIGPLWWTATNALPDLLAAAAIIPMYLPRAHSWLDSTRNHAPATGAH
ncbi:hypothetical protein [Streptomyces sp. NPDC048603]|uniref:hypothetical protein n=1 Tax=Streptomyces sp. NPDC048603 TaxID=3365577 RepID=UPI00371519D5